MSDTQQIDPETKKLLGEPSEGGQPATPTPADEQIIELDEAFAPEGASVQPPEHLRRLTGVIKRALLVELPAPDPIFSLNGHVFATPGNFSTLSALSKTGKSVVVEAMRVATLPGGGDVLGFSASNPHGKAVISIDTEQSAYHHNKKIFAGLRRKNYGIHDGETPPPDWYCSYSLVGLEATLEMLEFIMWSENQRCGGIHSVVVDGVADLITDVNDPAQTNTIRAKLMKLAAEYNTHIICVIHLNPGGGPESKSRGHLGSELDRKAEANLVIKVSANYRSVYAKNARDCAIPESMGTRFEWDDEHRTFMTQLDQGAAGDGINPLDVLGEIVSGEKLRSDIKDAFPEVTPRTLQRHIATCMDHKWCVESGPKNGKKLTITDLGIAHMKTNGRLENLPA